MMAIIASCVICGAATSLRTCGTSECQQADFEANRARNTPSKRRPRAAHSPRDERRIDELQRRATERVGRGASISVHAARQCPFVATVCGPRGAGYHVAVLDAAGEHHLIVTGTDKSSALARAIRQLTRRPS